LDRRTNRPEGSGRAAPTVVTPPADTDAPPDGDRASPDGAGPAADGSVPGSPDGEITQVVGPPVPTADTAAGTTAAPPADVSARPAPGLPADTVGAFTRSAAKPILPGSDDPTSGGSGGSAPVVGSAADEPEGRGPIGKASFRTASVADSPAADPAPTVPSSAEPPARGSATGFTWNEPEPAPPPMSSAARTFPGAAGHPRMSAGPAAAGAAAGAGIGEAEAPPRIMPPRALPKRPARQAHLTVARIEPWSVMKFSFVVSLVAFVILFVAVSVLYGALAGFGVFDSLQRVVSNVTSSQSSAGVNASTWFSASRVLGYTALLGSLNIVLITAMSTIAAVIYNLTSRLVGGVEVTLRETE